MTPSVFPPSRLCCLRLCHTPIVRRIHARDCASEAGDIIDAMTVIANVRLFASDQHQGLCDVEIAAGAVTAITPAGSVPIASADRIDAQGRWLLPGLWDRHVHMNQWAMARRRFDLTGAVSAEHAAQLAARALADFDARAGQPLTGFGFRSGLWGVQPDKRILDATVGGVPTVLISWDLHSAWLNSAALLAFGFSGDRDGIVRENECFDLLRRLADVPDSTLDGWVADAASVAASRGVVGVVDMEMAWSPGAWVRRATAGGRLSQRIEAGFYAQDLDRVIAQGLASGSSIVPEAVDPSLVRLGPLKIIADGSLNTRTAYCFEPYGGAGTEGRGVLNLGGSELVELLSRAREAGVECAVHAIGDAAVSTVCEAFAASGAQGSVEHVQLASLDEVKRLAELGLVASVQPQHAVDDRPVTEQFWPDRVGNAFRLRSLVDAGVRVRFGSDAPVAVLDPWVAIAAAVFRCEPGDEPWQPGEALSVVEAVAASSERGRADVRVGDVADIVLVDVDPAAADAAALKGLPVAATFVGGVPSFSNLG